MKKINITNRGLMSTFCEIGVDVCDSCNQKSNTIKLVNGVNNLENIPSLCFTCIQRMFRNSVVQEFNSNIRKH